MTLLVQICTDIGNFIDMYNNFNIGFGLIFLLQLLNVHCFNLSIYRIFPYSHFYIRLSAAVWGKNAMIFHKCPADFEIDLNEYL